MRNRASWMVVGTLLALGMPSAAAAQNSGEARSISVAATATSIAANDMATLSLGTESRSASAGAALRASGARMRRVIARLKALGVAGDDIQTTGVDVSRYTFRRHRHRLTRYLVTNEISAVVRVVRKVGGVIDAAVAAGATSVGGPDFSVADPEALYEGALVRAFDRARAKAQRLAAQAQVTLGAPLSITEGSQDTSADAPASEGAPGRARRAPTPVQPGTTRVEATISVVFAIS